MSGHDPRDDYDDAPVDRPLAPPHIVQWPASAMWAFGLLQFIFAQLWLVFMGGVRVLSGLDDGLSVAESVGAAIRDQLVLVAVAIWAVATTCTVVVMRGANDLRRFRRYPWVVAATVLTMLAIPFFYLAVIQLPLGLWVLYLVLRRDVRARFDAVACGKIMAAPAEAPDARRTDPA